MQEDVDPTEVATRQVRKLSGHTRDRRGCLTCRQRKKKCDVLPGCCRQCERLNLKCVWEAERSLQPAAATTLVRAESSAYDHRRVLDSSFVTAPHPLQFWIEATDNGSTVLDRRLALRYYVQTFAGILSTNAENNGFLSVLLPMAMESAPLVNTIIAWSSSHLALYRQDLAVKALEDRSSAITCFLREFASGKLPREISLAACLILVSMESILGDTTSWYDHLAGAASIIRTTFARDSNNRVTSSLEATLEGRWLLRNFAYHDILASVTVSRAMLIPNVCYWFEEGENVVDTYFGLASVPMAMIAETSALSERLARIAGPVDETDGCDDDGEEYFVTQRATNIERRLLDWQPGEAKDQSLVSLADSYRSAALIQLYRTLRYHRRDGATNLKDKIVEQANIIFENVANMPFACLPECTLLFPIFLAGGETDDDAQREILRQRMQQSADYRHFENISVGLSVLEEVWAVRTRTLPVDPARPYDWTEVLERRGWKLALS